MKNRANILYFLSALLLLGFGIFLWEYAGSAAHWAYAPGSPYLGKATVTDRTGLPLTHTQDTLLRKATVHFLGDRQGNIPSPAVTYQRPYDLINGLYTYGGYPPKICLTLDADLQKAALSALGEHRGTIAFLNYETGELLCSVTNPTFDPDDPGGTVDSMYVNRFVNGLYTPGSVFKLVTLAAALEEDPQIEKQTFLCTGTLAETKVTCPYAHGSQSLQEAFRNSCNCTFGAIALTLGGEKMAFYAEKFGLTQTLTFDGISTSQGRYDSLGSDLAWSGAGQATTLINPCSFLTFVAAIAGDGQGREPYLVKTITQGGKTLYRAEPAAGRQLLSRATAKTLQKYLRSNVRDKYGDEGFMGLSVCAKTGTAEAGGEKPNAMLCGFVADKSLPIAFFICVEEGGSGEKTCLPIAEKLLKMLVES